MITYIIVAIVAALAGIALYILVQRAILKKKGDEIIRNAETVGENIKKEKIFQAKEKFLQLKSEYEDTVKEKNSQLAQVENRLRQKESQIGQQNSELNRRIKENDQIKENLQRQLEIVGKKKEEYESLREDSIRKLEEVAGMSAEEAKEQLINSMKAEAKTQAMSYINDVMDEARLTASKEAKRIVINTIQRTAPEVAIENAVTVFNIENDEVKGRIIGREGRNIRALEAAIGVEIVVDDTPDSILISAFDPVRREVARLALHQLIADGRIHPARIEEVVAKVSKQLDEEIMETGKRTCIDLGIHGLNSQLVKMVGRMKYRSSYGQNLLQHSREVANISAILASELGLNPKIAKRAARYRQGGRGGVRASARNRGYEDSREVQGEAGGLQRDWRTPRGDRDGDAHRSHRAGGRCHFGLASRCPQRGHRLLHQASQGYGEHCRIPRRSGQGIRHSGGSRTARDCGCRAGERCRVQRNLRRGGTQDSG